MVELLISPSLSRISINLRVIWIAVLLKSLKYKSESESYSHSRVWLFAIPWTAACLTPLSIKFSRQESWSGLLFPSPGDLPDPGLGPEDQTRVSCIVGRFFSNWATRGPQVLIFVIWRHCALYSSSVLIHISLPLGCKLNYCLNWWVPLAETTEVHNRWENLLVMTEGDNTLMYLVEESGFIHIFFINIQN